MKRQLSVLLLVLVTASAFAAAAPSWAFPPFSELPPAVVSPAPALLDDPAPQSVPGSTVTYTRKQLLDLYIAKDWFPDAHPHMPAVVAGKADRSVLACAACHQPDGMGHPESAALAGLPPGYIARQLAEMRAGLRKPFGPMAAVALQATSADAQEADLYFSALPIRPWIEVVETALVPETIVRIGYQRSVKTGGGMEPIGDRIIELPRVLTPDGKQDSRYGFVANVPPGSIERGRILVTTGGGVTTRCLTCHGSGLHGDKETPWIAGRSPSYTYRQLFEIREGLRSGSRALQMASVVERLADSDLLAIAAYVGSLSGVPARR